MLNTFLQCLYHAGRLRSVFERAQVLFLAWKWQCACALAPTLGGVKDHAMIGCWSSQQVAQRTLYPETPAFS